jgi:hypothetical protein
VAGEACFHRSAKGVTNGVRGAGIGVIVSALDVSDLRVIQHCS